MERKLTSAPRQVTRIESTPPSLAVVEAVASAKGISTLDLDTPLHAVVDPDALDSLAGTGKADRSSVRITFTYAGHDVTVHGDGTVDLS